MNQYKIYRDENYLVVVNITTSETNYGFIKEVFVDKSNINIPSYRIFNVRDIPEISLTISQILKEDGSAYTSSEFEDFYKQNTGNFNGGSSSPGVQSVTGVGVDNTDPQNPIINVPPSGVQTITGTTVDNTDPENPVINAVEEASQDGNQYVRRNAAWEELTVGVQTVSGSLVNNTDPENPIILADSTKENISNKTGTIVGNEASTTLYVNIAGLITYFQQKLTDSIFGTFINSLVGKTTPVDADSISIVDSADSNKQKKVSLTNFKNYLKTYFDTLYSSITEPSQITITTAVSITTATLDGAGKSQKGKNVVIANGASNINITVNGGTDFVASYAKHGTGTITFVQGSGRTLVQVDSMAILNGIAGSTATVWSVGTTDYLRISNA